MSETLEKTEFREGDIYRWRWADPAKDADCAPYRSYHCYSQLAVVRNGCAVDTFWHGGDNKALDPCEVELTLLGNVADLVEIRSYDVVYYRREDIVDMRHSNNSHGPIYRRKGAERDAETMLELIDYRIDTSKREIEYAKQRIEMLEKDRARVMAGDLKTVHL